MKSSLPCFPLLPITFRALPPSPMRFSHYRRPLFLLLLFWCATIVVFKQARSPAESFRSVRFPGFSVRLEGRVAQYPVRGVSGWRFILEDIRRAGSPFAGSAVMAYADDMWGASYGDRVSIRCRLSEPFNYSVPGNLDWRKYLAEKGIYAEARGEILGISKKAHPLLRLASRVRNRTLRVFENNFTSEQASVLSGMVLGEKKSVSAELRNAFQDSGAMHLLVASGSNVGFITFLVYLICSKLGIGKKRSGVAAMMCAGFYVLAAGLEAPLVRGYLMFSAALAGYLLDRDSGVFQGLVIACFVILAVDRSSLFDAGFQMSFIASYGIVVGMGLWDRLLPLRGTWLYLTRSLLVSFFAQAGLYPLMALYFHKISLISVLANVLLVPLSGVIMGLGFAAVAVSWQPLLFSAVKFLTVFVLGAFMKLLDIFASFEYSAVLVSPPSPLVLVASIVLALTLLHAPLLGFRRVRLYACAAMPVMVLCAVAMTPGRSFASAFSDRDTAAVLIRSGDHGVFLFNPGIEGRKLANAVLFYGAREIEGTFISSLSPRDWSGLEELSGILEVKRVFVPYGPQPRELSETLGKMAAGGAQTQRVWPGDRLRMPGLDIRPNWAGPGGYSGGWRKERLNWEVQSSRFEALVSDGGRLVEIVRAAGGARTLENRADRAVETGL